MSEHLSQQICEPCTLGTPPLTGEDLDALYSKINKEWDLIDGLSLKRTFKFKNFKEALEFVDLIGTIAEAEGHHPDIELGWGRVVVSLTTHKIHGLSRNDFIIASKLDHLSL